MGTSKRYGGSSTGLVPSWVDDPSPGTSPAVVPDGGTTPGTSDGAVPGPSRTPDVSGAGRLAGARGSFSKFARTGTRSYLGSALSHYVRHGTGGARRAARRMGSSKASGARLLGIVRDIQRLGGAETLRRLDLSNLAGRPAAEVFLALVEFVCPPGGDVDEAVARQAMLETIGDLAEAGVGDLDTMTQEQLHEVFLDFVAHSIEGRVMADLGGRGIVLSDSVRAVENAQQQLHDFVTGCTRGALSGRLDGIERLDDRAVERVVNEIYEAAFELVAVAGEAAE